MILVLVEVAKNIKTVTEKQLKRNQSDIENPEKFYKFLRVFCNLKLI